tara:strand:+ start:10557 stop:11987 length:1431 start_codon:yes stop_codon:yes gene_type:complete
MLKNKIKEKVYGWGRSTYSNSYVCKPLNTDEIKHIILFAKQNKMKISNRAAGRSYGDNTLNENNIILDISNMNKILHWDLSCGIVTVQSGATVEKILINCIKSGWIFPVMPGTRFVTMAGCLSNNVHGKNAFHKGYIGEHVLQFKILLSNNKLIVCSRKENVELFYSVISGLGLIGVITEVTIQMIRVPSFYVKGNIKNYPNFAKLIEGFEKIKHNYEYSIAWVDTIFKGANIGRGELNYGNFIKDNDFKVRDHEIPNNLFKILPNSIVPYLAKLFLNNSTMKLINSLQFHTGGMSSDVQNNKVSLSKYNYLMDMKFPKYNYFFKQGFFLYQPILPIENCIEGHKKLIKISQKYGFPSVMSSLKAYRKQKEEFLLTFSMDGYSITMDIPKNKHKIKEQVKMFYEMNDYVIENGGKIYLGKTPVLTKDHFKSMYSNLNYFFKIKNNYDPESLFESNMLRRIMNIRHENLPKPLEINI